MCVCFFVSFSLSLSLSLSPLPPPLSRSPLSRSPLSTPLSLHPPSLSLSRSPSLMMRFGSHDWLRYFIPTVNQASALIPFPGQRTMFPRPVMNWPDRTAPQKERGARAAESQTPALRASRKEWDVATYTLLNPEDIRLIRQSVDLKPTELAPCCVHILGSRVDSQRPTGCLLFWSYGFSTAGCLAVSSEWKSPGIVSGAEKDDDLSRAGRRVCPWPALVLFWTVTESRAELSIHTVTLNADRVPW